MKKLFAILVVFTLIAGAVFADVSFGGDFGYKAGLFTGNNRSDTKVTSYENSTSARLDLNFSGEKYGGKVRLYGMTQKGWWQNWSGDGAPFAFAWWKPISQFQFQIGHNADGNFGAAQITGWGFNGSAQDFVAIDSDSDGTTYGANWKVARSAGFYGGFSNVGITLSVLPISGLSINFALPLSKNNHEDGSELTKEVFKKFHVNVAYSIPDIGAIRVSFQGLGGTDTSLTPAAYRSAGTMYASFYLTMVQNMAFDVGLSFGLPYDNAARVNVAPGLGIGFGVRYTMADFGVKLRVGTTLAGKTGSAKNNTVMGVAVLPYYNLGILTVYFNAGMGFSIPDVGDIVTDWFINPYIRVPVGGLSFWAGFKLGSDGRIPAGQSSKLMSWAVPIGVSVGF